MKTKIPECGIEREGGRECVGEERMRKEEAGVGVGAEDCIVTPNRQNMTPTRSGEKDREIG